MRPAKSMLLPAFLCLTLGLDSGASLAADRSVDKWVTGEAADYVATQLRTLPRFRDNTVRFVLFEDGRPATRSNRLALRLRDKLRDTITSAGGIRVAWQPGGAATRLPMSGGDCEAAREHLLVGLEVTSLGGRFLLVSLRALDVVEQTWIPGFAREWRGELSRGQHRALLDDAVDRSFVGERGVPYGGDETDLIARHLAHDLRCQLMGQVGGEYRVGTDGATAEGDVLSGILPLVRNQVSGISSVRFVAGEAETNARLESQLHTVDRTLHQYWITLTPTDATVELQPLSASVYVNLRGGLASAHRAPGGGAVMTAPATGILGSLDVINGGSFAACEPARPSTLTGSFGGGRGRCAALRVATDEDAVVFVLNHQLNRGLVRLDPQRCGRSPTPRIARRNEAVLVALPGSDADAAWTASDTWNLRPDNDTYYAIASSNSKAARALAAHISRLPVRCSESVRSGLTGAALQAWLQDFASELERWSPATDWHSVRLQQVY